MKKGNLKILIILLAIALIFAVILEHKEEDIISDLLDEGLEENEISDQELEEMFDDELFDLIEET